MASHEVIAPWGRWGGELTSRPLPLGDPSIETLSDDVREDLVTIWIGRAASERRVADAFEVIRDALVALEAPSEIVKLATRGVDDEYRHTEISQQVASAYAGKRLDPPPRLPLVVPSFEGASEELRHVLHVFGHCAVNETTASAFLETCLHLSKGELARAVCRELLSDEIDHARIGWGFLESLRPQLREQMVPWLLPIVRANLRVWRETRRAQLDDELLAGHGAPPPHVIDEALIGAVADLIVPGLDRLGMPTEPITRWLAEAAPSEVVRAQGFEPR